MEFAIIVAVSKNLGIGRSGKLPWKIPEDMDFFKNLTTKTQNPNNKNVVIMGRKTFESIGNRPLPKRYNICISTTIKNTNLHDNLFIVKNFDDAMRTCKNIENIEKIFIIGGSQIYNEALKYDECNEIICNIISGEYDCDAFFPKIDLNKYELHEELIISDRVMTKRYIKRT